MYMKVYLGTWTASTLDLCYSITWTTLTKMTLFFTAMLCINDISITFLQQNCCIVLIFRKSSCKIKVEQSFTYRQGSACWLNCWLNWPPIIQTKSDFPFQLDTVILLPIFKPADNLSQFPFPQKVSKIWNAKFLCKKTGYERKRYR